MAQREWVSWLAVALWAGAIFATIPVARAIERFVEGRFGEAFFLYVVLAAVAAGTALAVRALRRLGPVPRERALWLGAVALFYAGYAFHLRAQPVERVRALDDALTFGLRPAQRETLLFVSQQHHPGWSASGGGRALETVLVNDFYQGVLVPAGVERVELTFRGWVHWSWVPQVLFAVLAAGLGVSARRRRSAGSAPSAPAPRASP